MSAEEALTARLADLESDSFQLKLRNYYLERRVSKELGGERRGETALRGLLATAPETPPRRRTTRDFDDEKPSRRRSWRTTDVSETSKLRALERRLGAAEDALDRETRLRQKAEVALEVARSERGVAEARAAKRHDLDFEKKTRAVRDEVERVREEAAEARQAAYDANQRADAADAAFRAVSDQLSQCEKERTQEREKAEELVAFEAEQIAHLQEELASHQRRSTTDTATSPTTARTASRTTSPRTPVVVYNTTAATTPATLDIMSAIDASFSWLPSTTAPATDVRSEIADLHAEVRRLRQTPQANGTDLRNELRELRDEVRALSGSQADGDSINQHASSLFGDDPLAGPQWPDVGRRTTPANASSKSRAHWSVTPAAGVHSPESPRRRAPPRRFSERKRDAWPPEESSVPGLFGDDVVGR